MNKERQSLIDAVWKKALGYTSTESVEEYGIHDGQMVVSKQKVTTKDVAPDIAAAKLIMKEMQLNPYQNLSDNELEEEKERLLRILKEAELKDKSPLETIEELPNGELSNEKLSKGTSEHKSGKKSGKKGERNEAGKRV